MDSFDGTTDYLFGHSYLEARIRYDHPLRAIRPVVDEVIAGLLPPQPMAARRPRSISPVRALRAMLLHVLYSVPSDRALMGWLEHDLPSRWFVGMGTSDAAWDELAFSKQRDWLVDAGIADRFLAALLAKPEINALLSADDSFAKIAPFRYSA